MMTGPFPLFFKRVERNAFLERRFGKGDLFYAKALENLFEYDGPAHDDVGPVGVDSRNACDIFDGARRDYFFKRFEHMLPRHDHAV